MPKMTKSDLEQTQRNLQFMYEKQKRELEVALATLAKWDSGEAQKERAAAAEKQQAQAAKEEADRTERRQKRTGRLVATIKWAEDIVLSDALSLTPALQPVAFKYLLMCQGPWGLE